MAMDELNRFDCNPTIIVITLIIRGDSKYHNNHSPIY